MTGVILDTKNKTGWFLKKPTEGTSSACVFGVFQSLAVKRLITLSGE
jgi:hypothetical protein